jgi:hypothetical protein
VTENLKNITVGYEMKWFQCGGKNEPNFRFSSPILGLVLLHEIRRVRDILKNIQAASFAAGRNRGENGQTHRAAGAPAEPELAKLQQVPFSGFTLSAPGAGV